MIVRDATAENEILVDNMETNEEVHGRLETPPSLPFDEFEQSAPPRPE